MTEYLIGTGGWAHLKIPNKSSLKTYSKIFSFVEVNYTFYRYPSISMVERWRRTVPKDFTFTVRCHQDLTHRVGLRPDDQAYATFSQMISICRILDAPFLHLLTPRSYIFDHEQIRHAKDFFSSIDTKGIRLAWEARSQKTAKLVKLMQDLNIVHSVDISKEDLGDSDAIYTRIFGKGKHNIYQFTDKELKEIDKKIVDAKARMALVTWHGVKMTSDATRFKKFKETGKFLPVTAYTGINSVRAVLSEDAKFPATKTELLHHQGWKVIDLTTTTRTHLSDLLSKIPEKTYNNIQEVAGELEAFT